MNFRFPAFIDLSGKRCLVAGEGDEIPAKVKALVDAGAHTIYVSTRPVPQIEQLAALNLLEWRQRDFEPADLEGCFMVISDLEDNSEIFRLAEERRILCNSVDDPEHCRFSFGSVHRSGDLMIAISTNGVAPAMAVRMREKFEREIGPEYGALLNLLKRARTRIANNVGDFGARRTLWYRIVDSEALTMLRERKQLEAEALVESLITEAEARMTKPYEQRVAP
jgi:precorrin-2 dehydrogenase / sirohydrochlorin ferrochelatase